MGKSFQIIFSKSLGLSQNTKQGVSAVSRNALFFRCGYSPDLLAALQGNPGQLTPFFASVAVLTLLLRIAWKRLTVCSNGSMRTTSPAKSMIADWKSCLSIMKMSRQNCRRASLPKCSLMHQKAEQRDFRHAVLSKAINLSYAPLPARSLFLRRRVLLFLGKLSRGSFS